MIDKPSNKLNVTKDYRLFHRDSENRNLNPKKHRNLFKSLSKNGFLRSFPLSCLRDAKGNLHIKDGQHRLAIAEQLGLPVYWVEEVVDYDIAEINNTAVTWCNKDYAEKYIEQGLQPYIEGMAFAERHGLQVGIAFALLGGCANFSGVSEDFRRGQFRITDRKWAEQVATLYNSLVALAPEFKGSTRLLEAVMCLFRTPGFDGERLLSGAERQRDKLVVYSTRDAYLEMLEKLYNFQRSKVVPLKMEATLAMRKRSAAQKRHGQ